MDIASPVLIPFLIPITLVIFMLIMQLTLLLVAGVGFDFDADHDVDLDADLDLDMDVDLDVDVPIGVGVDAHSIAVGGDGVEFDHHIDPDGFSLGKFLSPLGVGQVPLSVVWNAYALSFGISGVALSVLLAKFFAVSFWFLGLTIPLAIVFGWHATKRASRLVMPLLKTHGIAECKSDAVGRTGKVTSLKIDDKWGEAVVTINGQSNHVIVRAVDDEVIEQGSDIVIVGYDEEMKRPIVGKVRA